MRTEFPGKRKYLNHMSSYLHPQIHVRSVVDPSQIVSIVMGLPYTEFVSGYLQHCAMWLIALMELVGPNSVSAAQLLHKQLS